MKKSEEKHLITLLKNPDHIDKGFDILVNTFKQKLYWHIRYLIKNHEDSDDVLQNTFIKVYRNIQSFKEESKLYTWLYRIATNEALTFLNKRAKHFAISYEELQMKLVENLEADPYFDGDYAQLKFQKAIASLPKKQQQVFIMKYYDELKYQEMSKILTTSEGALKASYHLAVKKIEQFIKSN